jgi:8-oxo-dGTP pyrophosphatase MutT (NUDIX family)
MARNYEVHIGGKPLVIGLAPDFIDMPRNWIALRLDDAAEMTAIARNLLERPGLEGIHLYHDRPELAWEAFCKGHEPVQAAGGAVEDAAGRLLAIHRLGRWDLPKGKLEAGEEHATAALREVQEECGLHQLELVGHLVDTWHVYERNGKHWLKCTRWFRMRADGTQPLIPQVEEDIREVRWMDAAGLALLKADTWPSLLPVVSAWEGAVHGPGASGAPHRP